MKKINSSSKKWSALLVAAALHFSFTATAQTVIFNESFGVPSGNQPVNTYTGYDNGSPVDFSDNGTDLSVRTTNPSVSSNYSYASGGGNVLFNSAASGDRTLIISGIDISGASNLELKFGLRKGAATSDGTAMKVAAIVDNGTPITLTFNALTGTAKWYDVNITNMSSLPAGSTLTLTFNKSNDPTEMRIDDVILTKNNDPMPVKLSSFQAFTRNGGAQLVWKTNTELNTAYFAVERSLDGKSFKEVGKVTAQNTKNGASYKFDDVQLPMAEKIYYRLKMVDIDQKFEYSSVASVWMNDGKKGNIQLQGNVVKEQLILSMNQAAQGMMSYQIIDLNGRVYASNQWSQNGNQNVEINISNLNAGFYILKVNGSNQQETFKFVKQ